MITDAKRKKKYKESRYHNGKKNHSRLFTVFKAPMYGEIKNKMCLKRRAAGKVERADIRPEIEVVGEKNKITYLKRN